MCTFREYTAVQHEQKAFEHLLGVVLSRGAVSGNDALFAKAGKQTLSETHFSCQMYEYLQLLIYWLAVPEECVWATAPVLHIVGTEQPWFPWAQQCWDIPAFRGGLDEQVLLHTETWQVLATTWERDVGPQSCHVCIIPDSRRVSPLSSPTAVVAIEPTYFVEPVQMLFKVFLNTLLRHCWYSAFSSSLLIITRAQQGCIWICRTWRVDETPAYCFWVVTGESQKPFCEPGY